MSDDYRALNSSLLTGGDAIGRASARPKKPAVSAVSCGTPSRAVRTWPLRLLTFTSLYPNAVQPQHGLFVEERLRRIVAAGNCSATVMAPVPWFPSRNRAFGAYAKLAMVPPREERFGIEVLHPRYPVIPKVGMSLAPFFMYCALLPVIGRLLRKGVSFDLIDAHYFYPDGVAAVALAHQFHKPVVVTARGTDLNVFPHFWLPRRQIVHAVRNADAVIAVSQALGTRLMRLGQAAEKISVLRNGVDLERFRPLDRSALRAGFGLRGPVWLAVGHLVESKRVQLVLEAVAEIPEVTFLIVGEGPDLAKLKHLARQLQIESRVQFLGVVPQVQLAGYYNAADATVLASSREGMPNVVLESLACGTPVIVTPFESARELVAAPEAGRIADGCTGRAIVNAWRRLQADGVNRVSTRRFAERFGWGSVIDAQRELYARVLDAFSKNVTRREFS